MFTVQQLEAERQRVQAQNRLKAQSLSPPPQHHHQQQQHQQQQQQQQAQRLPMQLPLQPNKAIRATSGRSRATTSMFSTQARPLTGIVRDNSNDNSMSERAPNSANPNLDMWAATARQASRSPSPSNGAPAWQTQSQRGSNAARSRGGAAFVERSATNMSPSPGLPRRQLSGGRGGGGVAQPVSEVYESFTDAHRKSASEQRWTSYLRTTRLLDVVNGFYSSFVCFSSSFVLFKNLFFFLKKN